MLYTAELFLIPESTSASSTKGYVGKLRKIQRQASLHVMGTMKSSPMDAIDACANLLPFHLLIGKVLHHVVNRLATLPQTHPLAKHIIRSTNRYVKRHRSPLHEITHAFNIQPGDLKTINPVWHGPKWGPAFPKEIATSRWAAIEGAQGAQADMKASQMGQP